MNDIASVRGAYGLTQVDFSRILGVHPLTVSKWELGKLEPTSYQAGVIWCFRKAIKSLRKHDIESIQLWALTSPLRALHKILEHGLPKE